MEDKLNSVDILGVRVDKVSMNQAIAMVERWVKKPFDKLRAGHYIVTPNPEFIMLAKQDESFRTILHQSDLAIPDGSRLEWANSVLQEKNFFKKFLIWLTFLFPSRGLIQFDTVAGVELMERLCKASIDWGSTIGLLGGKNGVAEKTAECLMKRYQGLKITYVGSGGEINKEGNVLSSKYYGNGKKEENGEPIIHNTYPLIQCDILFVAYGQGKQEKWIAQNLQKLPVKVMMGVGGSFDEISGLTPKPPKWIIDLKLKWLFRLITEPWRISRQLQLVKFLWLVLTK